LPSVAELIMICENKAIIETTTIANGGTAFGSGAYWSSTEYNKDYAYVKAIGDDCFHYDFVGKGDTNRVRAIRRF
jgi:hypothetical protein